MNETAAVTPRGAPALQPFAVQHVEQAAERGLGLDVVREPPRRPDATAIRVEVLDLHALVEAVLRARPPEARSLYAAPRRLARRERVAEVVDPDHARIDPACDAVGLREITRPHTGGEPELGRIRAVDGFLLAV